jgi:hypothetical protein
MREARYVKPLTINISEELYDYVQKETTELKISMSEWVREASELKIKFDQTKNRKKEE